MQAPPAQGGAARTPPCHARRARASERILPGRNTRTPWNAPADIRDPARLTAKVSRSEDRFQMRHYWQHGCPVAPSGLHVDPRSQPTACKVDICVRRW